MTVARRTQDTMLYIQSEWNKRHADTIDKGELHKFLCDEQAKQKGLLLNFRFATAP